MTEQVVDATDRARYELVRDGEVVGFAGYQKTDEIIVLTHTEVDPELSGQGIGGKLVRGVLDHVRELGLKVLPVCPFVEGWMAKHPDYQDLDYRSSPNRPVGRAAD